MSSVFQPQSNEERVAWLLTNARGLTVWELDFLDAVQDLPRLSVRQQAALDGIWRRVADGGVGHGG